MTKRSRILVTIASVIGVLIVAIVIAVLIIVQTSWFQNYVREKIVSLTEESTGGKVELGSFSFDWRTERVTMKNFAIHGTEPAGSAPLLNVDSIVLQVKLFPSFKHVVDLEYLGITHPAVDVMVFANGKTNIPQPKVVKKSSGKSGLQTVVDLAVHKFELTAGTVQFSQQSIPLNVQGENLLADLAYNPTPASYVGKLSMDPISIVSGQRAPINAHLELPVRIEGDAIQLTNGKFTAGQSNLTVSASLNHIAAPVIAAQLQAHIALPDVQAATGAAIFPNAKGAPNSVDANAAVDMDDQRIEIKDARLSLGDSKFSASGLLRDAGRQTSAQFTGKLDLGQIGRLLNLSAAPQGTVDLAGRASLPQGSYLVTGNLNGRDMTARSGASTLGPVNLHTDFRIDPKAAALTNLLVKAFGGELVGNAQLAGMQYLKFQGQLRGFQLATLARAVQPRPLTYDGTLSGTLNASADLKAKGTTGFNAQTQITIAPAANAAPTAEMPVSGRLFAKYSGANETVALGDSYIAFPHSRVDLSGVLGNQVDIKFLSRNLNDFLPALNFASSKPAQSLPVTLRSGGSAALNAKISGPLKSPQITGHVALTRFAASGRAFDQLAADLNASPSGAQVDNGLLKRGTLQAKFAGGIGLHDWSSTPRSPVNVNADIQNADLADVLALAGAHEPVTGKLTANVQIDGTLGNPAGGATVSIGNGSAYGEPFDRADAKVTFADQLVTLNPLEIVSGPARVSASGTFEHPRDSFNSGHLQMQVATTDISLAQFKALQSKRPGFAGIVKLNANAAADLVPSRSGSSQIMVRNIDADLSAKNIREGHQQYGDLTASAKTAGTSITYLVDSDLAGSNTTVHGVTQLAANYPTTLDASIKALQVEKVLALAGKPDMPVRGNLSADAHLNGTLSDPHANVSIDFANGSVYDEPINDLNGKVIYSAKDIDIPSSQMSTPAGGMSLSGNLSHGVSDFNHGHLVLHLNSGGIQLAKIHNLQKNRPGIAGTLKVGTNIDANLNLQDKAAPIAFSKLDANVNAGALRYNNEDFGDVNLQARTQGKGIAVALDSDLAKSSIHGRGVVQLASGYPVDAKLDFTNIDYANFAPLLASVETVTPRPSFDGRVAGQITVNGPVKNMDQLRASISLSELQLSTVSSRASEGPGGPIVLLQNQQPIVIDLNHSLVIVRSAHLSGRSTDISASGTASIKNNRPLDLKVNATTDLALLQQMNSDIYSSGVIAANATIRGTMAQPAVNGKIEFKNASVNITQSPNGLSNANGVILLNGTNATIQSLTAESGGGKISLAGFAGLTGRAVRFALRARAANVRTRYSGASIVSDAALNLTGTTDRSLLSGTVTVDRIAFNGQSDVGSILSSTATPPQTPSAPSGFLSAMRLDIRVVTSPALSVQTSVTQNLQADADLSVRGTALNPGILGRMNITSGEFVFFGNRYTVNRGIISFFNPVKIQPILDVNLETSVKGVDVILGVTGPIDNMKLSYRSDPPLRFDEIVGLLATGKVPTSDPTIAANQPPTPDQSLTQMGESAIVSQAVAAPLASRIQRVFGVNQLKIDPTFVSGSSLPQARVTLQQQVSPTIVFTYTTDLTQTTSQIIRLEWAFTPRFSAVATRDEYGIVSLDFFVKRQFR